jgi:beta-phosphoglucomutase
MSTPLTTQDHRGSTTGTTPSGVPYDVRDVVSRWADRPDRAVLFDFNGTLSDDEPIVCELYAQLFDERLGWTFTHDYYAEHFAGFSDLEIIATVVAEQIGSDPGLERELLHERHVRYRAIVEDHSPVSEDAVRLVRGLRSRGIPMGVVTGAPRDDVELVLGRAGLRDAIAVVVAAEDVRHGKPHPEGFLAGATGLGIDPASALVFEDSLPGARSARAARMACIGITGTCTRAELLPETSAVADTLGPDLFEHVLPAITDGTD